MFVARNRYATYNKSTQVLEIRNLNNESAKQITLTGTIAEIFYAGTGQIILASNNLTILYDVQTQEKLAEIPSQLVRYVYWNSDMSYVALVSRHSSTMILNEITSY